MTERTSNLLKALFGLIIAIVCIYLRVTTTTDQFTIIGAGLGIFMVIAYIKRAFDLQLNI